MDVASLGPLAAIGLVLVLLVFLIHTRLAANRAERRAAALVRELLSPEEQQQILERRYLEVTSRSTAGRVYRIPASPGLVSVLDEGKLVMRLCVQPTRGLPKTEHVLVHKIMLEGAEDAYWQSANRIFGRWLDPATAQIEVWIGSPPGVLKQR
jgi:hypothetical protein